MLALKTLLLVAILSIQGWSQSFQRYDGLVGNEQAEFRMAWNSDGSVTGSYKYANRTSEYSLNGHNKLEGILVLDVTSGGDLTARMSLTKRSQNGKITWEGILKGQDEQPPIAVSFSRKSEVNSQNASNSPVQQSGASVERRPNDANGERVVKDSTNGALIWCPYAAKIQWTGEVSNSGFAEGRGTLTIFNRKGDRAMIITGMMREGRLVGDVTAKYPSSPDRAHYVGGYSNWFENGTGTMTYNDGKILTGSWKDGELLSTATVADQSPFQDREPLPSSTKASEIEPPDPDTAGENLQKVYNKLTETLQGEALQKLKICQRAWIKYNEAALKISSNLWDQPNESWEGADRFDALMAWHRTQELQFTTDALFSLNSGISISVDLNEQTGLLSSKLKRIAAEGRISAADMAALKQYWDQSCQLVKLIEVQNESPKEQSARALLALFTKNLNEILDLWLQTSQQIASTIASPSVADDVPQPDLTIPDRSKIAKSEAIALPAPESRVIPQPLPAALPKNGPSEIVEHQDPTSGRGKAMIDQTTETNTVYDTAPLTTAGPATDTWVILLYLAIMLFVIIAMIAIFMGVNEKLTIYNGSWDLILTCIVVISSVLTIVWSDGQSAAPLVISSITVCTTLILSFRESWMANDTFLRAALAVPAKFILIILLALCGLLAIGGVSAGVDELKKGNKGKAAKNFAFAAIAALGASYFKKLIETLVKERVTKPFRPVPLEE